MGYPLPWYPRNFGRESINEKPSPCFSASPLEEGDGSIPLIYGCWRRRFLFLASGRFTRGRGHRHILADLIFPNKGYLWE